jgi:hypothetical protein
MTSSALAARTGKTTMPLAELSPTAKAALLYFGAGLSALILAGILPLPWSRFMRGQTDFLGFYTGAALIGTDGLYSQAANRELQQRLIDFTMKGTYYVRPPFYAALLRPLAFLPYLPAYWVFQALSLVLAGIAARLYRGPWQLTAAFVLFFPLTVNFMVGQDIALILLLCTATLMLHRSARDTAAGFVLSLCLVKFHLFLLVPLVLLRHRKWRMIAGAAAGASIWLSLSTLISGPSWPRQYLSVLRNPVISLEVEKMPSIRGILAGSPLAAYAAVAALAIFLFAIVKLRSFEDAFGLALAGGLLLNTHSYLYDCVILLPALVSAIRRGGPAGRAVALFLMTPIPYVALLLGHGAIFLVCVIALVGLRTMQARQPFGDPCGA